MPNHKHLCECGYKVLCYGTRNFGHGGTAAGEDWIGVVGQQRGALLARGSTVKQKKPNDE